MKKKFIALIIILIIVSAGIGGFLIYYFIFKGYLPECNAIPFTEFPADMSRITTIVPLGNLNPPDHTFPTDHMYFNTNITMYPDGFDIFAPGDLYIDSLTMVEYDPPQGNISQDFTIDFSVCKNVWGRFGHVNNLSVNIWNIIGNFGVSYGDEFDQYMIANRTYTRYIKNINFILNAGDPMGIAGLGGGYDFWLKDNRVQLHWVNQEWTNEFQNTVCPLRYFTESKKSVMFTKLNQWGTIPVVPANYCGRIDFDITDRAQGVWVKQGWVNRPEEYGLGLVYDNFNASRAAISLGFAGNSSWDSRVYTFTPVTMGFKNRQFSDISADGNIYYYLCNEFLSGMTYTKTILIKMTADRTLRFQFIDMEGSPVPPDPTVFWNESVSLLYTR
jgi:hypothetical protein